MTGANEIRKPIIIEVGKEYTPYAGITSLPPLEYFLDEKERIEVEDPAQLNQDISLNGITGRLILGTDYVARFDNEYEDESSPQPLGPVSLTKTKEKSATGEVRRTLTNFPVFLHFQFESQTVEEYDMLAEHAFELQLGDKTYIFNCVGEHPLERIAIVRGNGVRIVANFSWEREADTAYTPLIPYTIAALQEVSVRIINLEQEDARIERQLNEDALRRLTAMSPSLLSEDLSDN